MAIESRSGTEELLEELRLSAVELRTVTNELLTGADLTHDRAARMDRAMAGVEAAEQRLVAHLARR